MMFDRQAHAMVGHLSGELDPRERWPWWGCRCGVQYEAIDGPGLARRDEARILHRDHLRDVEMAGRPKP